MDDRTGSRNSEDEGMPRWVKMSAIIGLLLAVLVALVILLGRGNHGPGRHLSDGIDTPPMFSAIDRGESVGGAR